MAVSERGHSRRSSDPCFSLERARPCVIISPTSTPGATAPCHSRPRLVPRMPDSFDDLPGPSRPVRSRKLSSCARRPQSVALTQKDRSANFWRRVNRRPLGYETVAQVGTPRRIADLPRGFFVGRWLALAHFGSSVDRRGHVFGHVLARRPLQLIRSVVMRSSLAQRDRRHSRESAARTRVGRRTYGNSSDP